MLRCAFPRATWPFLFGHRADAIVPRQQRGERNADNMISDTTICILMLAALPAAAFSDSVPFSPFTRQLFDQQDLAIDNGNAWRDDTNDGGTYSWGTANIMRGYLQMYRATDDAYYLDKLVATADHVLAKRDDVTLRLPAPMRMPAWSEGAASAWPNYVGAGITTGNILLPMVRFARMVHDDPVLSANPAYAAKAANYVARAQETIAFLDDDFLYEYAPGKATYVPYRDERNRMGAVHQDATMADVLLDMYEITGNTALRDRAHRLARAIRQDGFINTPAGNKAWSYSYFGVNDVDDLSHGAHAAPFMARYAKEYGQQISQLDAYSLAAAMTEEVYKGDGIVSTGVNGTDRPQYRMGTNAFNWAWGYAGGLMELAPFDMRLIPIASEVQEHYYGTSAHQLGWPLYGVANLVRYNNVPQRVELSMQVVDGGQIYRTVGSVQLTLLEPVELLLVNQGNPADAHAITLSLGGTGDDWAERWILQMSMQAFDAPELLNGDLTITLSLLDGVGSLKKIIGMEAPPGFEADLVADGGQLRLEGTLTSALLYTITAGEDRASVFDLPGDTDADGDVDLSDLSALAGHYGEVTGVSWIDGDFDLDGDVDLSDLGILAENYGAGETLALADFNMLTNMPEPAMAIALLVICLPAFSRRRGRR